MFLLFVKHRATHCRIYFFDMATRSYLRSAKCKDEYCIRNFVIAFRNGITQMQTRDNLSIVLYVRPEHRRPHCFQVMKKK